MSAQWTGWVLDEIHRNGSLPPGTGPTQEFKGPWFSTQMTLSLVIGLTSFFLFCMLRTKWDLVYMGRTKLKDFSPTPAHSPDMYNGNRFFGWIIPTLRTSEYTVLQTVGLDAAVLLNFYRMAFLLFSSLAFLAAIILMPLNLFRHGSTDMEDPDDGLPSNGTDFRNATLPHNSTRPLPAPTLYDVLVDPQTSATVNLLITYVFTALVLIFLHQNFHRFVKSRQTFSLHILHSISSRTVLVTSVPSHLRGDRALADYFEKCGWHVESVNVCREVEPLRSKLEARTNALMKLEHAWVDWVGNPAKGVRGYDPNVYADKKVARSLTASPQPVSEPLIPDLDEDSSTTSRPQRSGTVTPSDENENGDVEAVNESHHHIQTTRPRPTLRPRWFGAKVDAIEYWEKRFRKADEEVRKMRKTGKFDATHVAFVTFEYVKDAQMACQVVHYPHHSQLVTEPAPEPRDVIWSSVSMPERERTIREVIVMGVVVLILLFWIPPVATLATLLSYSEIRKVLPWLANLIDRSPRLAAVVQNTLPSLAVVIFNGLSPFLLTWLSYEQGFKSRSAVEYSLLKKYHLLLLFSVLFIFLFTTSFWAIIRDLADSPAKIPEKLASALLGSNARNFMISYVMLQAFGLMPMQLLNIGPLSTLGFNRATSSKTPRAYAEANAPPQLNYGWVYPQALLIFTLTLVFSVVSPLILVFGALYFGMSYLVYKYKLLFIYFKPYESNGEAWPITFARLLWALIIFQLFMTGLFSLRKPYWASLVMLPLILYTLWWSWVTLRDFGPLSEYLALSSICEVERGEEAEQVTGVQDEDHVTRSQANLNHRRYAVNDETLYVAPSDKRTDYSQPPMSSFYYGVLNTGRRRYAHPALSGSLPFPWLPAKAKPKQFGDGAAERRGVVLSLRRKMAKKLKSSQEESESQGEGSRSSTNLPEGWNTGGDGPSMSRRPSGSGDQDLRASSLSTSSNPWGDPTPTPSDRRVTKQISFDPGSGVIALPEDENVWGADAEESEEEDEGGSTPDGGPPVSPSTYFHHPERRRTISGNDGWLSAAGAGGPPPESQVAP